MTDDRFPRTLVVVPALNEAGNIARVVSSIRQNVPQADVLVINDGSSDATGQIAESAGALVLHMPYRVGIGAGVQTGFKFAARQGYEIVVRNDGDGQHKPEDIRRMLDVVRSGQADVALGSRYLEHGGYVASLPRRLGSVLLARIISRIIGQRITDPTSGFNAFNRRAIRLCAQHYPHDYPEPEAIVMLHRAGLRLVEVPVRMQPRAAGKSTITPLRSLFYMFKVLLAILIDLLRPAPAVDV